MEDCVPFWYLGMVPHAHQHTETPQSSELQKQETHGMTDLSFGVSSKVLHCKKKDLEYRRRSHKTHAGRDG